MTAQNRPESSGTPHAKTRVLVWDVGIRVFHWSLVVLFGFLWWSGKNDQLTWHKLAGFVVAGALAFRFFWGVFGSDTARFTRFIRGPVAAWRYLNGDQKESLGHNPIGGWSVGLMLGLLALQVLLGLFSIDEDGLEAGPLAIYISFDNARSAANLHALTFNFLLIAIASHCIAITIYAFRGVNLIGPMVTGRKRALSPTIVPRIVAGWRLGLGLLFGAAVTVSLWWLETH